MASFGGNQYPGVYQPYWWTSAATTTNVWIDNASTYVGEPKRGRKAKPPKPKTNLDWLRERVNEVCALAELGVAA
jgi:hypothetical protein